MKKLMTAFLIFLCIPFLISPINALEGGDINVNVSELLLSLEVTLSSDITINPNTLGPEESIISSSGLKVKNSSSMNVDVFAVDINSAYDNEFLEYSDDSIIWRNMGYEDTIEYIAFSIDNKDILPEEEVSLGTVFNKWDVENNEKTFNLNVKSGYAWKSTDILEREYPITLIFRIDEEDMSQHVDSSIQFIDFTSNKFGYSEVTIVCNGIKTIEERGFIYVKEGTEDIIYSISSDNSETYNSTFNDLEELSNYTVKAYVKADNNYYYSEGTLTILTPSIFKYEIDITGVSYTFKTTGGESFVVDWGDGVKEEYPGGNLTVSHMYSSNGIKTVEIKANKLNLSFSDKVIINVLSALPERTDSYMSSIFSGQTSLVSIPVELFYNNPQVTSFAYVFKGCSSLLEIPEELFKDCIGLTSSNPFYQAFMDCTSLESLPNNLFNNNNIDSFSETFKNCTSLTTISENIFNTPGVKYFNETFYGCTALIEIPENLFYNSPSVIEFDGTFRECTLLQQIPARLFVNNHNVKNFAHTFYKCSSITSIPAGLFDNNTKVTDEFYSFSSTFYKCSSLLPIPAGLFDKSIDAMSFRRTFYGCTSLISIPEGLFDKNTKVTDFRGTFNSCYNLVSIPIGLFDKNTGVEKFGVQNEGVFYNCRSLTSIPEGLFDKNTKVTSFAFAFYGCESLTSIPEGLFNKNTKVTSFESTFSHCTNLIGLAPELWLRNPEPEGRYCFSSCSSLTNYASIPSNWK